MGVVYVCVVSVVCKCVCVVCVFGVFVGVCGCVSASVCVFA